MIDRIRKLEIELIDAAIDDRRVPRELSASRLAKAIDALRFECDDCNYDKHRCPGDGKPIPHGATDCGEHDDDTPPKFVAHSTGYCSECLDVGEDPRAWCDCGGNIDLYGPCIPPCCSRAHVPENCPSRTEWVATTFLHIEKGDRLRIGQEEAVVKEVSKLYWHADNSDRYHPKPWAHLELRADVGFGMAPFPTDTAVEILCDDERKAQLIMSEAGLRPRLSSTEEN